MYGSMFHKQNENAIAQGVITSSVVSYTYKHKGKRKSKERRHNRHDREPLGVLVFEDDPANKSAPSTAGLYSALET